MASPPEGTPTPSCRGARVSTASNITALAVHFDVNRRRTSPTAIGRNKPI